MNPWQKENKSFFAAAEVDDELLACLLDLGRTIVHFDFIDRKLLDLDFGFLKGTLDGRYEYQAEIGQQTLGIHGYGHGVVQLQVFSSCR